MATEPAVDDLVAARQRSGTTISVCLPARNEEATVGQIVATVHRNLVDHAPLVDEVVVMDDGSTDATAEAAAWEGAQVFAVEEVLPDLPRGSGKGNALWKSLYVCEGDVIVWLDADVRNFGPHFVTRLVGPLLRTHAGTAAPGRTGKEGERRWRKNRSSAIASWARSWR